MTTDYIEDCRTAAALYSVGALPPGEALQFEQRLKSGCPFCVGEYAAYACVADEFALSAPARDPQAAVRQRIFNRIGVSADVRSANHGMKLVRGGATGWVPLPFSGVEVRPLLGRETLLVRMQPGAVYPAHEHKHAEQCYVLEGSVTDSDGVTAFAGDFVCMPAGSTHQEISTQTGCVFLLAYTA
jgi:mannose-6-phosphate isomerase-like protein (cupin superfamily)